MNLEALKAILGVALLGAIAFVGWHYATLREEVKQIAPLEQRVEMLQLQQNNLARESIHLKQLDTTIRQNRQTITVKLDQARTNDPEARAYLGAGIPDGVRRAYSEGHAERRSVPPIDAD